MCIILTDCTLHYFLLFQIRLVDKKQKGGKYTKKVKAKIRRKMQELSKPLEEDEFAGTWED